jgi:Fur family transcriptional regulator, ferric uptake regulator
MSLPPTGHGPSQRAPRVAEKLRHSAHKLTGPREAIIEALGRQDHPPSMKELFALLRRGLCDLATIYRVMHLLEKLGLVKRYDLGDRIARFELLPEGDDGHHHHLICQRCAEVVEIDECSVSALEERIASTNGFRAVTHRLEFFGLCPRCQ